MSTRGTIGYVESAQDGSLLGDPIEVVAGNNASEQIEIFSFCEIASVKSSLGHLEAVSGISEIFQGYLQRKIKWFLLSIRLI